MQVSQIYLSDSTEEIAPFIQNCINSTRGTYSHMPHVLYNNETLRQFLADNLDSDVVSAYDKLNPYAYRADLARYCLLYAVGGWYFDISVRSICAIPVSDDIETVAFRDIQINSRTSWACSTGVLYSQKSSPVYETAIKLVLENCKNEYYGITPLCPTGPTVLGRAFALNGASERRVFGDLIALTPDYHKRNLAVVLPDGTIAAFAKPTAAGGDLTALGAKGTNNYNELYYTKAVYKTS